MHSWIGIIGWHMDLSLSMCILMQSYDLVMYFKLGACPKYLIYAKYLMFVAKPTCGLMGIFNVGLFRSYNWVG